ncbi:bifunctional adenosylcobinamide kinase/adenosylcobinamide-phosphate guanylyltransferase [Starkeya koreensis]|uniref:Bifunctional adenosylcobalamin biosynthesis protein n=1 Tax=Ancylobacter koreensis TaxID=266121 RepID=A0ABT0DQU9_9HYPH|nr:bifunctional adenosylcobinamide kinase/adenosylcobinamide-phosphate guanylyltransferase [Ancylobacter koreensis]MCK0209650.1 bifunctional adenosylcobinamide kinase/adenosylcobinamide-phosphate guanylyltransferase [Ancylobacter koreensis]
MGLTLVLGGARSGKSAHAEVLVAQAAPPWSYLATAQAWDDEMVERIALHRSRRGGEWQTLDVPHELAGALGALPSERPVLVDCLTLWLTNRMLAEADVAAESAALADALAARAGVTVAVSNEVGLSIVPDNALARRFRDAQGRLNQMVAARAEAVIFMVAGLPVKVK